MGMFLSRSVYLYQGKSVWQFLTKCALTNPCRSTRTYQDKPVMLFIRRCLSGSAGGSLKKSVRMDRSYPLMLFLLLSTLGLKLLMSGRTLRTKKLLSFSIELKRAHQIMLLFLETNSLFIFVMDIDSINSIL